MQLILQPLDVAVAAWWGWGMSLGGCKVGGGEVESSWEMMADEEEEVERILQKLQVGP